MIASMKRPMPRRSLFGAALLALGAMSVSLHAAPVKRLHVNKSIKIAAPPAKVWDIVKNFGDLTWLPAVKASNATDGNTPGSVRTLDLGGPKATEVLAKYNAKAMSYSYRIPPTPENAQVLPVTKYYSTLTVKPDGNGGSLVTWRGNFDRADPSANPPAGKDDAAAIKAISGLYDLGLGNLAKLAQGS
jgi:hypothetical protein